MDVFWGKSALLNADEVPHAVCLFSFPIFLKLGFKRAEHTSSRITLLAYCSLGQVYQFISTGHSLTHSNG